MIFKNYFIIKKNKKFKFFLTFGGFFFVTGLIFIMYPMCYTLCFIMKINKKQI
jgi:hypothetical protein